ncbi:hypothetical protein [Natronomonas pharaonis]|nr:hypothetical protein [Natronomonas pharaonis]
MDAQQPDSEQRHAFKFETPHGDTALMVSEGNRTFWERYGDQISIVGWCE